METFYVQEGAGGHIKGEMEETETKNNRELKEFQKRDNEEQISKEDIFSGQVLSCFFLMV